MSRRETPIGRLGSGYDDGFQDDQAAGGNPRPSAPSHQYETCRVCHATMNEKFKYIYQIINPYYAGLNFTRLQVKDQFALYYAQLHCQLSKESRYIVAVVPHDCDPYLCRGTSVVQIDQLPWLSLQDRLIDQDYRLETQLHCPRPNRILSQLIMTKQDLHVSEWKAVTKCVYHPVGHELPFEVTVTLDIRRESAEQYDDQMVLARLLQANNIAINLLMGEEPQGEPTVPPRPLPSRR